MKAFIVGKGWPGVNWSRCKLDWILYQSSTPFTSLEPRIGVFYSQFCIRAYLNADTVFTIVLDAPLVIADAIRLRNNGETKTGIGGG